MGTKAHSIDLRSRVVDDVAAGSSRRQAAARFRVSVSSAIRWVALREERGGVEPRPRGGKSRSPLSAHTAWLLAMVTAAPDLTLAATVAVLNGLVMISVIRDLVVRGRAENWPS